MDRHIVLQARPQDLRALPLSAREGFFASQFDGRLTLEEVAELAGFDLPAAERLAERLLQAGAIAKVTAARPARARAAIEDRARPPRADPRAEGESIRPAARRRSASHDLRGARRSSRPGAAERHPTPRPERAKSRKSLHAARAIGAGAAAAARKAAAPPAELDAQAAELLRELEAKIGDVDHYGLLGVERDAEKKAIKRAYFRLAAAFHPDRYFGKDLGAQARRVQRVFEAITAAHDTLVDAELRAAYDARARRTRPSRSTRAVRNTVAPPKPRNTVAPPKPRNTVAPPKPRNTVAPPKPRNIVAPKPAGPASEPAVSESSRTLIGVAPPPRPAAELPAPPSAPISAPTSSGRARAEQLRLAMHSARSQGNVEALVKAAEEAVRRDDFVAAANHYRLALAHGEDPILRLELEEVDARARVIRFEKNIAPARAAERDQRWADAAVFLVRAHEARPDADVAARAAAALRLGGGDLEKAAALAEEATAREPRNVGYLVVLGEVYVAANRISRAEEALAAIRALAPRDARADELAASIAKRARSTTRVY